MEQVFKELSLYDLTGYLVPGVVVVLTLVYVVNAIQGRREREKIKIPILGVILAGYIAGHMLQAIATLLDEHVLARWRTPLFWQPINQLYASDPVFLGALNEAITSTFAKVGENRPFILCQTYLRIHGIDGYTDIMTARYAFFKGLTLALFISFGAFLLEVYLHRRQARHRGRRMLMVVALLAAAVLSYSRLLKFEHYYIDGVYRTFYVSVNSNTKPATNPGTP